MSTSVHFGVKQGSSDDDPESLLDLLSPGSNILHKDWKPGMKAKGTSVDYTSSAGKINLSLMRSGKVKSKSMRNFIQDAEAMRDAPGQTVLNAVIYAELLGDKPERGPPCLFKYPSTAALNKVKDELGSALWYNGFGCMSQKSSNDTYKQVSEAPHVPLGRAPFVIGIVDEQGSKHVKVPPEHRSTADQVDSWSTLDPSQKASIRVLFRQRSSLLQRMAEEKERRAK